MVEHQHAMTLYNFDLVVTYVYQGDAVRIKEVKFPHAWPHSNLVEFMSKRVFQAIVEDIEKQQQWDGRNSG